MVTKETSAGFVVYRPGGDGRPLFLLLHYSSGHWDLPKGHVEKGENLMQTARRELMEETGIAEIEPWSGFEEKINYSYRHRGRAYSKDVHFFLGKTNTESVKLSHEHKGFKWLPYDEAMKQLTFANAQNVMKKAFESMGQSSN